MLLSKLIIALSLAVATAHLSNQPCTVVQNSKGSETDFSFQCTVTSDQKGGSQIATFSRPFQLSTTSGIMLPDTRVDPIDGSKSPFSYYFNPLGSLAPGASILKETGCDAGTGDSNKNIWIAGAYQWDSRKKKEGCKRLTGEAKEGFTTTTFNGWSAYLLDDEDASAGLMLHMSGGDACGIEGPRKFNISLMCGTDKYVQAKTFVEESVIEDQTCTYEIDLETTHGCPDECKAPFNVFANGKEPGTGAAASTEVCNSKGACRSLADGTPACACTAGDAGSQEPDWVGPGCAYNCPNIFDKPCSNNGHCAYDPGPIGKAGGSRCFCNTGFEGTICDAATPTGKTIYHHIASAAPWVILFGFGIAFSIAWWHHRKQKEQPFCCCGGGNGYGEGFEGNGPPAFSALGANSGGYVAPNTDSAI